MTPSASELLNMGEGMDRRERTLKHRPRVGFTLIELLVVIAIIGVLVALIMPAVQSAREAGRRTQCINNLRQLALAAQEYHDALNFFPAGWYCDPNDPACIPAGPAVTYWNGLTGLLLKLEQGNLMNEINFDLPPRDRSNTTSVRRTIEVMLCPSNRRQAEDDGPSNPGVTPSPTRTLRMGYSDYRGNMAAGVIPNCTEPNPIDCLYHDNGIHFRNSEVDHSAIGDGSSFTAQFGECLIGTWSEATSCCVRTLRERRLNRPFIQPSDKKNNYNFWMSKHPGLVNFAFCDGRVSTIKDTINRDVLVHIMTRNGGEAISGDAIR